MVTLEGLSFELAKSSKVSKGSYIVGFFESHGKLGYCAAEGMLFYIKYYKVSPIALNTQLQSALVGKIVNQGKCGSCWAVSAVESMADRLCIRKSQHNSFTTAPRRIALSSLDVIACDKLCEGLVKCCRGCTGGYPKLAFTFFEHTGVVSVDDETC